MSHPLPESPLSLSNPLVRWIKDRDGNDGVSFNFHAGQKAAWESKKRVVLLLAGSRGGKTSFAPLWLYREMRLRGPGDYLVAAPDFTIIDKAAGPEIERVFGEEFFALGTMTHKPWKFTVSKEGEKRLWSKPPDRPTRIIFGHADTPESLEAMTIKAAWLDEAGQKKFKSQSWETIRYRRVAIDQGRILITTTPYNFGWLKEQLYDKWRAVNKDHPDIDVFQFASTMNPSFSRSEMEAAKRDLPKWRYEMMYLGLFTKPAGIIYDCFDEPPGTHKIPRFDIPADWPRYVGLDFGGVNTAAVFLAEDPETGKLYAYREYHQGGRTAAEHSYHIQKGEPPFARCAGGSGSEDQWRREFAVGGTTPSGELVEGLSIHAPSIRGGGGIQSIVEVGINRVYGAFQRRQLYVFDHLKELLDELGTYSRVLDDQLEPTEVIDEKDTYHMLDALRYIIGHLNHGSLIPKIHVFDAAEAEKEVNSMAELEAKLKAEDEAEEKEARIAEPPKTPQQLELEQLHRYLHGDGDNEPQDEWAVWR